MHVLSLEILILKENADQSGFRLLSRSITFFLITNEVLSLMLFCKCVSGNVVIPQQTEVHFRRLLHDIFRMALNFFQLLLNSHLFRKRRHISTN